MADNKQDQQGNEARDASRDENNSGKTPQESNNDGATLIPGSQDAQTGSPEGGGDDAG